MKGLKLFAALALSGVLLLANINITQESWASGSAYIVINAEDNKVLMEPMRRRVCLWPVLQRL